MHGINAPVVSVIIPTYNRAHLVSRAIQSVLNQTFTEFELIVVDDASIDDTEETIKAFNDRRIKYLRHAQNRGGGAARNTGLEKALGEYVAFLDSDDEWLPQKLEKQMQIFTSQQGQRIGAVGCASLMIEEGKPHKIERIPDIVSFYEELLSFDCNPFVTNWLIAKQVLKDNSISFDGDSFPTISGDRDYVLRLTRVCELAKLDEPLCKINTDALVRDTSEGNYELHLKSRLALLSKYQQELAQRPRALARHHVKLAMLYFQSGDFRMAKTHLRIGVRTYKSKNYILLWLISLLGKNIFSIFYRISKRMTQLRNTSFR